MLKSRERHLVLSRNKQNSVAEERIEPVFLTSWVVSQVRTLVRIDSEAVTLAFTCFPWGSACPHR